MEQYYREITKRYQKGLFLAEAPTGLGKTYAVMHFMKDTYKTLEPGRRYIYITTLKKNLPEEMLKSLFQDEEAYNQTVLRISSNFDEVVNKICYIHVPQENIEKLRVKLANLVEKYNRTLQSGNWKEIVDDIRTEIVSKEREFRYRIKKMLQGKFKTKEERLSAIKTDKRYRWIGELYPAVFSDEYKIILLSVSKFMKKNSVIVEDSYSFIGSELVANSIIFIDEFDETKVTIKNEIIKSAVSLEASYINLFVQLYRGITMNQCSAKLNEARLQVEKRKTKNNYKKLERDGADIYEKFHLSYPIKTNEQEKDDFQNFLFNDGIFYSILGDKQKYVRGVWKEEEKRTEIFLNRQASSVKIIGKKKISLYTICCVKSVCLYSVLKITAICGQRNTERL